jgi:uncharacterized membrane protein YjgN (DUF898 family)
MMDNPPQAAEPTIENHALRFTGDGGVYLGVWLVNLLLMAVTLGLFTPFARRRTLKYFYGHTDVAGHPLEFTGSIRRMFVGFLLFFALYLAWQIASGTGQVVATTLLGLGAAILGPYIWGSAQRFRAGATRWRGIRGRFEASWPEVYAANWPLLILIGIGVLVGIALVALRGARFNAVAAGGLGVLVLLGVLFCIARLTYNYARLRMTRTNFGGRIGQWSVSFDDWLKVSLQASGLFLLLAVVVVGILAMSLGGVSLLGLPDRKGAAVVTVVLLVIVGPVILLFLAGSPAMAWAQARTHVLVWNNAGLGTASHFRCNLQPRRFVALRLKNMLLTLLTFGLWRPFAVTSEYRMKLESVSLHVRGGLDQLVGQKVREQGATGDALADAFGLDLVG